MSPAPTRILFVCTGNICRSPSAEGVLRKRAAEAGLSDRLELDSAGLGPWHVGHPPDERAAAAAAARGYRLDGQIARQVTADDFARHDLILAMDHGHLRDLQRLAPAGARASVRLFLDFAADAGGGDVPDPYYGGRTGFETMMDLIEAGVDGLLAELAERR
jgi:protein-tyrosine phosphatase